MISKVELNWTTCFEAKDEANRIRLLVTPEGDGRWQWQAFDFAGDWLCEGRGFVSPLEAQANAVEVWRGVTKQ